MKASGELSGVLQFVGCGIVFDYVVCEKRRVFGGARCSCHRVCEAPGASGGAATRGRGRGRGGALPVVSCRSAERSRGDRKTGKTRSGHRGGSFEGRGVQATDRRERETFWAAGHSGNSARQFS